MVKINKDIKREKFMYEKTPNSNNEEEINKAKEAEQPINILLIEDNQADARLVTEYLKENENYNFNVIYSDCLTRALLIIKEKKTDIDVIILDLGLPDCTGLETFRRVWTEQDQMIPIIILTGSTLSRHNLRCCVEESYDFLQKGFIDSTLLVTVILSAIERSRAKKRIMFLNEIRTRKVKIWEGVERKAR